MRPGALTLAAVFAALTSTADKVPDAVVRYNARDYGAAGWRRVKLELKTGERVTQAFQVVNIWQRGADETRTLFLLEEPAGLRGTCYLLTESPTGTPDLRVNLYLPAGKGRVLTVAPASLDEGLMGSDFTYRDLRFGAPITGFPMTGVGKGTLLGTAVEVVEVRPTDAAVAKTLTWTVARHSFAHTPPLMLGADYSTGSGAAEKVTKQMRVEEMKQIDKVWTPTRIVMKALEGRSSVLTLLAFHPNVPIGDKDQFEPEALPAWAARVKSGWKPETREK